MKEERTLRGNQFGNWMIGSLRTTALIASAGLAVLALVCTSGIALAEGEAANAPDMRRGEQLYELCTQCHGTAGGGNSEYLAPAIAGLPEWYVEGQLKKFKDGIRGLHAEDTGGLRMYPMSLWLRSEADQKSVAAYVASMAPPMLEHEIEMPGDAAKGAGYYAVCSACHSPDGSGNQGMGAPPLVGQSDWYLYSSIQKYKEGVRGSGPGDTLGPAMIGMVATLPDDAAIRDVIAHIQTLAK